MKADINIGDIYVRHDIRNRPTYNAVVIDITGDIVYYQIIGNGMSIFNGSVNYFLRHYRLYEAKDNSPLFEDFDL